MRLDGGMGVALMAVRAEWTKLRTTPGPAWLLLVTGAVTVALGAAVSSAAACARDGCGIDGVRVALGGVYLGQASVAVLAVLVVSGEYSTGLIRTTFAATPGRATVLAAKAVVLAVVVAAVGSLAVVGSLLVAGMIGLPRLSVVDGPMLRAAGGSVVYLVLIAVLGLGAGVVVRDSAAAIGAVLGVLYLPPILGTMVADPHLHRLLERGAPMSAGLSVQATTDLRQLAIGPWAGLGVLAVWSGGALLAGVLLLRSRDT
ncbi:ABC transporter permease subunit [Paractinoplanes globisporus]|uniref:ABC transporter permease subunit n=1 Tax=Paractinoplanes globisporus TaxID=113565 RepID=A0ABW6WHQ8_9ACTN|nr:ABC transporter permease subunit [Actinoplanes globisporus]